MSQSSHQNTAKSGTEVFVGGLPVTITEERIHEIFSACGEIVEVRLIKDQKGHQKGYCFVRFANKEAADKAVKEKSECLVDGKKIGVLPSAEQNTLFLGNLNKGWSAEEFEKFVRQIFPDVVSINLVMLGGNVQPGQKLRNRGFAFVKFSSHAAAARAYRAGSAPEFVIAGNVHPSVKWAEEESETDPEELAKVKTAFVRDLPATADENYMRKLFEPCGKVDKVILHKRGDSQIGFIYFDKRQDLDTALKEMNGKLVQGPQVGSPYKLQVELAKPMDKKRKRAPVDFPSKSATIVQSQCTLPQNYLGVHSSDLPATKIQKEVQHADSYENAIVALPLAVKERLLRILRLGIASRSDIDEDCLFRLKELPESNAISVLDQFMLSGAEMQDKGAFLAGLISKNMVNRLRLDQNPSSLSRDTSTLSREPVLSSLSRRTHLPDVDYMVNNTSLASRFDSTDSRSDIYTSRYSELHSNYLSSHSMLGRMKDGSTSDTTYITSLGNPRGRLSSDVASLTDYNISPLRSTSSYTGNPRIGLHSSVEGYADRVLSPLRSIENSRALNSRIGLNSHTNGPIYESVSPTRIMPRHTTYGRSGLTHTAAAADQRTMETAPTTSLSYNRVSSLLDEATTANSQQPRHQVRFDPFTGEPYRFDPFTGEPILPDNSSRHN